MLINTYIPVCAQLSGARPSSPSEQTTLNAGHGPGFFLMLYFRRRHTHTRERDVAEQALKE